MFTVLIVDDSPANIQMFKAWLEHDGFHTLTAASGAEGVALAKSYKPDAIIMDVVMPGMNGFKATRRLARNRETDGIPVVMVTSENQELDTVWGMLQGAVATVPRLVTEEQLVHQVREALACRHPHPGEHSRLPRDSALSSARNGMS